MGKRWCLFLSVRFYSRKSNNIFREQLKINSQNEQYYIWIDMEDLTNFDSKLTEAIRLKPNEYLDIVSLIYFFSLKRHVLKSIKCQCQMSMDFLQHSKFKLTLLKTQECFEICNQASWTDWLLFLESSLQLQKHKSKPLKWLSNAKIAVIKK